MKNVLIKLAKNRKFENIRLVVFLIMIFLLIAIKENKFVWISLLAFYFIDAIFTAIRKRPDYVLEQNKLWRILISNEYVIAEILVVFIVMPIIWLFASMEIVWGILFSLISVIIVFFLSSRFSRYLDKKLIRYD